MKKILKTIVISSLVILILLGNLALAAGASNAAANPTLPLEERLIGTWRWEGQHSWLFIFREDGTILDGPPGLRTIYNWQVVGDRLIVDGVDWNLSIEPMLVLNTGDNISFSVDRFGERYTYIWYSDSTEGETSSWLLAVFAAVFLVVIGLMVLIVVRIVRRRKRETYM